MAEKRTINIDINNNADEAAKETSKANHLLSLVRIAA
jgi:hypothetical protein